MILVSFVVISIGSAVSNQTENEFDWFHIKSLFSLISFAAFLILYLLVFGILMIRLKTYYPNFYKLHKKRLTIVTILLVVSLVSKITFQSIYANEAYLDSLIMSREKDTWLYPVS